MQCPTATADVTGGLDVAQRWRESMSLRHNSNRENGMSHR